MQFRGNPPLFILPNWYVIVTIALRTALTTINLSPHRTTNSGRFPRRSIEALSRFARSYLLLLGMTNLITLLLEATLHYSIGINSRHRGLTLLIRLTFRWRDQLLICFSRAIADSIVGCRSIKTTFLSWYLRVNIDPTPFLCCSIRWQTSDVTPVYKMEPLSFVNMYTQSPTTYI